LAGDINPIEGTSSLLSFCGEIGSITYHLDNQMSGTNPGPYSPQIGPRPQTENSYGYRHFIGIQQPLKQGAGKLQIKR
jgi:hypothetical protein